MTIKEGLSMSLANKQVGARMRDLREIFEFSVSEVAAQLGIEETVYLAYENGKTDIPIGFLYEVANCFKVELTALLTGEEPKLAHYALSRDNGGIEVVRMDGYHYRSLAFNFSGKQIEPLFVQIQPAEGDIVQNGHPGQEWDYILEGTMRLKLGERVFELKKGDSIYFDSSIPHGMQAVGGALSFLAIILETPKCEEAE